MKAVDVVATAFRNAFRSRLRTSLTVLAIFIGAFTLSLTNGLGTGINRYIDDTVASVGVDDVLTVTVTDDAFPTEGPAEYDPDQIEADGPPGATTTALTDDDLETVAGVDGVLAVEPVKAITTDYVQYDGGDRYQLGVAQFVPGMRAELASGRQVDLDAPGPELVLPEGHVEPLGLGTPVDAVGRTVVLAVTDGTGTQVTTEATVVGVAEPGVLSMGGAIPNDALAGTLYDLQTTGAPAAQAARYASASVTFDASAGPEAQQALVDRLADAGYTASTLEDQLGTLTSVIDAIVLVLNGFAVIALVAAGIGIVNTLFMAVQERTREVGLMKAMGLSSTRVFSLFSIEAVVIGLVGSALGVLAAIGVGQVVGGISGNLLPDLPGLTLIAFEPVTVAVVVLGVMGIAFLAGTLPALRAARQDPISSLRYE
ncbi:ABC transporter permease [Promicromonospora thailandica]|uniref:ABC transport system permease protein n=1 Tax=Promicromonospora thailandica TaxID=765201 RepID=A0A9X2GCD3_9MICO|nr:ABC transporter permease [Promicromonospora thailandica]MCP2266576.1 putative ABC transport system permease protein [Promicromonospora thailandica]BFF17349.1 ABC transporter permease [Promicromonospora thailandica]